MVHVLLKPGLENFLSITLLACEMSAIVEKFEHSLALTFFGIGMKTDLLEVRSLNSRCWQAVFLLEASGVNPYLYFPSFGRLLVSLGF